MAMVNHLTAAKAGRCPMEKRGGNAPFFIESTVCMCVGEPL